MIIKSRPLSPTLFKIGAFLIGLVMNSKCKKLLIEPVPFKPNHSYILMCNHLSFWDGFWAAYMCNKVLFKQGYMKKLYIMSLKKQMEKNKFLQYIGSFSIEPRRRSMRESFEYAAEILSEPGNLLLFYPQGNLESAFIRYIKFDEGLHEIVPMIKGDCQLIWSSNLIEFFESFRPTIYGYMLDCGTNKEFDFEDLKKKVNEHHLKSIHRNIRYTTEPPETTV
jgi:hypothetical protein